MSSRCSLVVLVVGVALIASACSEKSSRVTADLQPACQRKVCTPCDCGSVSDGCGGTLSCGACPTPRRCTETYGAVEGFVLCGETDSECSFNARKGTAKSCREVCEASRGSCVAAYANTPDSCDKTSPDDVGCDQKSHAQDICVCTRKTSDYSPLPCALDGSIGKKDTKVFDAARDALRDAPADTTPAGKLLYRVTFESGSIAAVVGKSNAETMSGGTITAVANPKKDAVNGSSFVGRHYAPSGYTRAELSSQRLATVDKTYTYKWSYLIPSSFFASTISWDLVSQWKTYPCGDHDGYDAQICGSCGIFDELNVKSTGFEFRYRAEPDCYTASASVETDSWIHFVMQVKWTNTKTGFVKLWKNGKPLYDKQNIKTLFDDFKPTTCDLYWAVGVYSNNTGGLEIFTDDIEIWEGAVN